MTMWKRALALGATAVLAAACSSTGGTASSAPSAAPSAAAPSAAGSEAPSQPAELTKVRVQLKWVAQAQFAGYYAAVDQGYYADQGLDVQILLGGPDIDPVRVVASDGAEFGTTWVPAMLAAREGGADVVDISQVFQRSGTLEVSFKDKNITKPEDLKNKKVGSWLGGNEPELFAALNKVNINPDDKSQVEIIKQDFDMSGLLGGSLDAAQAMTYNEFAQVLEAKNPATGNLYQAGDLNVISFNDVGTGMLQDAIFARESYLAKAGNEDIAAKFLAASLKGWIYCRDNSQACVDIVLKNGSTLGASHQAWQMNEINALIWPSPNGVGALDSASWDQTVQIATTYKVLKAQPSEGAFRTDLNEKALGMLGADVDTKGAAWAKTAVELKEGGN
jgi:NitT/TauT family transport system substrate-binding protein